MQPGDPVVGGVALRRAAIQSPNYVHGVSGWAINQDGSAEFNSVELIGGPFIIVGSVQSLAIEVVAGVPSLIYWMNGSPANTGGITPQGDGALGIFSIDWGGGERQQLILGHTLVLLGANNGSDAFIQINEGGGHSVYINLNNTIPAYLICDVGPSNFGRINSNDNWHNLALQNGWTSGSGSGFDTPQYVANALGRIEFKGLALAGTKANGTVIATLPAGYQPPVTRQVICSADGNISPFVVVLHINTDGTIQIFGLGAGDAVGLDGVFFDMN